MSDPEGVADVQTFFATHDIPQNHITLLQEMERQRLYAEMRVRVGGDLVRRFRDARGNL